MFERQQHVAVFQGRQAVSDHKRRAPLLRYGAAAMRSGSAGAAAELDKATAARRELLMTGEYHAR
jgi:hypothetical protein